MQIFEVVWDYSKIYCDNTVNLEQVPNLENLGQKVEIGILR